MALIIIFCVLLAGFTGFEIYALIRDIKKKKAEKASFEKVEDEEE